MEEVSKYAEQQKSKKSLEVNPKIFKLLEKELGEFEIIL